MKSTEIHGLMFNYTYRRTDFTNKFPLKLELKRTAATHCLWNIFTFLFTLIKFSVTLKVPVSVQIIMIQE